ncbi:Stp1/IreP family PP2C-type Ser/Thr phosphatase [bacterium]|nr:Stp1/IreP family PP2C-type Ser/Thr phosphatase [bacterium]
MKIKGYALTDIGLKRKINQDAFLSDDDLSLYVVADGMGGHRGGEVASQLAVEVIRKFCRENKALPPREKLDKGVNLSCQQIYDESKKNPDLAGMGTTIVAVLFHENVAHIAQVGDSRAYLISNAGIWQVTEDHSLMNEEIRAGRLAVGQESTYQFRNVITRSVGYEAQVNVDIYRRAPQSGDYFLLCTDGLSGMVNVVEIKDSILKHGPEMGLKSLIGLANARGGDDNITALVVEVV